MAAVLNLDPVPAQYQLGLSSGGRLGRRRRQLALLNPTWVELVAELDDLIRKRPPQWYA